MSQYQCGSALISEAGLSQHDGVDATSDGMAPLSRYLAEPSPVLARLPAVHGVEEHARRAAIDRQPKFVWSKRLTTSLLAGVGALILLAAIVFPLLKRSGETPDPRPGVPSWAPPAPAPAADEAPAWKPAASAPSKPAPAPPALTPNESSPPAAESASPGGVKSSPAEIPSPPSASNWPPVQIARSGGHLPKASDRQSPPIAVQQPARQVASEPAPTVQRAWPSVSPTSSAGPVRVSNPTVQAAVAPSVGPTAEPASCPWPRQAEPSVAEMASRPAPVASPANSPRYDGRSPQASGERMGAAGRDPSTTSREELYRAYYAQRYGANRVGRSGADQAVGAVAANPTASAPTGTPASPPASAVQSPPLAQPAASAEPGVARFEGTIERPTIRTPQ